jgi:hypothetical protein
MHFVAARIFAVWIYERALSFFELFLLFRDQYTNVLSTELHAQADVARRLNFQTDWIRA